MTMPKPSTPPKSTVVLPLWMQWIAAKQDSSRALHAFKVYQPRLS